MTRKDYKIIAEVFKFCKPFDNSRSDYYAKFEEWEELIKTMADVLKQNNDRFNKDKFFVECGLK